jgi:hypothetical protein
VDATSLPLLVIFPFPFVELVHTVEVIIVYVFAGKSFL